MGSGETKEVTFELIFERQGGLAWPWEARKRWIVPVRVIQRETMSVGISEKLNGSPRVTQLKDRFAEDSTQCLSQGLFSCYLLNDLWPSIHIAGFQDAIIFIPFIPFFII